MVRKKNKMIFLFYGAENAHCIFFPFSSICGLLEGNPWKSFCI